MKGLSAAKHRFLVCNVMVFGARTLAGPLEKLFAKTANEKVKKIEHWVMLALDCVRQIGVAGTLMLVIYSAAAWVCECLMYVSIARAIGLTSAPVGPWQATAEAKSDAKAVADGIREGWNRNQQLNLNSASKEQLVSLPGMTSAEADRVIAGRPYGEPGELVTRRVLSKTQYDKIADRITAK